MYSIIEAFVDRKRATIMLLALLLLMGWAAYSNIPKESSPDIEIPIIHVSIVHPGISPEDGEKLLIRPLENALRTITSLKTITSHAFEGYASIQLEFDAGFKSSKALNDVRQKVEDVESDLPADTEKPKVTEFNVSMRPVLNVSLTSNIPPRTLLKMARDLKTKIEALPGILKVDIAGDREDVLEIEIDSGLLENYGLSLRDIRAIISGNNTLVAAGAITGESGKYSIKVPSLIKDLDSLMNFPVKVNGDAIVRVKDLARVKRTFKDASSIARVNGEPAVVLEVVKRSGYNVISTVNKVKETINQERKKWPSTMQVVYSQDDSEHITEMVSDLENSIILAVILVMIVVILSVGTRSALLISISIPTSFLAGILLLQSMDMTLNTVVLFSLILTVGMIVDDAIVVSEYADRKMIEGMPEQEAFLNAAQRMMWPVVTATVVKLLVFMPLLFWPGIVGQFMKFMPITAIVILTASMIFALFIQPTLGPLFGRPSHADKELLEAIEASEGGDLNKLTGITKLYADLLQKALDRPNLFVLWIFGGLVAVYMLFILAGPGSEFFPNVEPNNATIIVRSSGNLSVQEKDEFMTTVEKLIIDMQDKVRVFYSRSGVDAGRWADDTIGCIQLEFIDWYKRPKASVILDEIRKRLANLPGIIIEIDEEKAGPQNGKPIQINISATNYANAEAAADQLKAMMERMASLLDIEDSRAGHNIEWRIEIDRGLAALLAVDVGTIGETISLVTDGLKISTYRPEDVDDEVDIVLRLPKEARNIATLDQIKVINARNEAVPMSSLVKRVAAPSISKIKRYNRERVITLGANVKEGMLVEKQIKAIQKWIKEVEFDSEIKISFLGEQEDQEEAGNFLFSAFLLAIIMMFVVMLIQFNNFYHTIIIMSAVFLATGGVLMGLILTWQPFGVVMCGVGVIALGGIVLNNNILFVDTYQYLRREGVAVREAIIRAGIQRLRPILLTAATAILGLLPMVIGLTINLIERDISYNAPSSQWWRQLSASIAGGLTFATILTLFFTPCLLLIGKRFDRYKDKESPSIEEEKPSIPIEEKKVTIKRNLKTKTLKTTKKSLDKHNRSKL
jgi:multidrug efflux pump